MSTFRLLPRIFLGLSGLALLTGCSGVSPIAPSSPVSGLAIQGAVHGGQQPVSGATITLWAVGTTGDGSSATNLTSTTTNGSGSFTLGTYSCPVGNPVVYITAANGNPGLGGSANNTALLMMAALTDCNTLKANAATTFVFVDEVTTLGAAAALYPYMTATGNLSYGSGDAAAFATAFSTVSEYTNTSTGTAPGPTLPSGYYASSTEINTLGNILASCINTAGGVAGDLTACGNLFNLTKSSGVAPTNTLGATLNILNNPTQNAASLFSLAGAITPFQPVLSAAPTTWTLPILQIAATPSISIAGGTYSSAQFVTLSDTSSGATIYYTTDSSTPTASSTPYTGTITVASTETLKAVAVGGGFAASPVASAAYTITGSSSTFNVNGQVNLSNGCATTFPPITMTLSHSGTVVQTTTTNSSGAYSFSGVPNDTYTITPSITGPTSLFYPASQPAVVSGGSVSGISFTASLGYTVSGTVAYGGSQSGQIYLALNPTTCGGGGTEGTSISAAGTFIIDGVPPGAYTLQAFMDTLGRGAPNASDPTGSTPVTVTSANLIGQNVSLTDPATVTVTTAPTLSSVSAFNSGVAVQFKPIKNSSQIETPLYYTLQWSTDPSFATISGSKRFNANGTHSNVWLMHGLVNGSIYYFRTYGTSAGTPASPFSSVVGPVTIGAPTGGNTVTGSISFGATATGPMYVAFLDNTNGSFYGQYIASPASAQAYTIQVPTGSNYYFLAILDQNSDGLIDPTDLSNVNNGNDNVITAISGPTSNENLTLSSADSTASVTTQNFKSTTSSGTSQTYNLSFRINGGARQPVAVSLASGPNLVGPVDIALCGAPGTSCGQGYQISFNIGASVPTVGDTYTFNVSYADNSTGTVTATVSAVLNAFATSLAPTTGTSVSTTPTFSWVDPINASNYTYVFNLNDNTNATVWQIPGQNSNSNGFSSTITSIPWITSGNDVTGASGNLPSVAALTLGATYSWQITVQDSNGNSAVQQVQYQP